MTLTPEEKADFEKRFSVDDCMEQEGVLSFIDTLLHKREQAWRERVEGKRRPGGRGKSDYQSAFYDTEDYGYNKAIDDVLSENITDK